MYRFKDGEYTLLSMTVDDVLIATRKKSHADQIIASLRKQFKLKDMGIPEYILGLHIKYDRKAGKLQLGQQLYIEMMAKKFNQLDANPVYQPADKGSKLKADMASPECTKDYRSLVGSLIYAVHTRPYIAVPVSNLAKYLTKPQEAHWQAAVRVLRYLYTTKERGLTYQPKLKKKNELEMYADASFQCDYDTSRSRTGYLATFNDCLIMWKSRMQPIVADSSCEAEYYAMGDSIKEADWLRQFINELKFKQKTIKTWIDNKSSIKLAEAQMVKPNSKHIRRKYHMLRERVQDGRIKLGHIPGVENPADVMTKNLSKPKREHLIGRFLC